MPPHCAKRAKPSNPTPDKANDDVATDNKSTPAGKDEDIAISADNGKSKLIELPVELLLEIMLYFPAVHIPTSRRFNTPVLPPSIFERWDALRALSQTCQLWRTIFYPMLWERMEACAVRAELDPQRFQAEPRSIKGSSTELNMADFRGEDIPRNWYKGVSRLLGKLSKGLTTNPEAAKHVRTVNVSLTRCSPGTVLPAFVGCLEILPNLQTLQILRAHTQMTTMLKSHFENHTFPAVRTIIVPDHGHEILRCCTEVRKVVCNDGNGSKLVTAIAKCCPKVEVVEGIDADKNILKRLVKACPNIRELKLGGFIETNTAVLALLASLKNLVRLELRVGKDYAETYHQDPLVTPIIKAAREIMNNSKAQGKKTLKLYYDDIGGWDRQEKHWVISILLDYKP
ncbi:hypothetical protein P691DRAFT_807122 [Macrolepiota fuliginosa MF-IS2]|uniref:F-box domain-containing protein n=1 Tax=Macrolepiota fuliginosa MF-IS2 TaxID=1400762 RepID=A0A9P5X893_9AGAR|nr:hypothetical protein P691DRAFT_807122 [Macrolepiota fuliginosa MF-IS2]